MYTVFSISTAVDVVLSRGNLDVLAAGLSEPQALVMFGAGLYAFALMARRVIRKRELRAALAPTQVLQQPEPAL